MQLQLICLLNTLWETAAGELLAKMPEAIEDIRQLAYFFYTMYERKGNAEDARYYNELMTGNNTATSQPGSDSEFPQHRHYFGTIELDSLQGTMQFVNIMSEIISHFTAKTDVKAFLKLDIETHSDKPFDSTLERTVKENGAVLGIRCEGFTEE